MSNNTTPNICQSYFQTHLCDLSLRLFLLPNSETKDICYSKGLKLLQQIASLVFKVNWIRIRVDNFF